MMTRIVSVSSVATLVLALAGPAAAQQPAAPAGQPAAKSVSQSLGVVVFPAKGQAPEQQGKDESECYGWSKQQTGIDPAAPPPQAAAPAPAKKGGAVKGAAKGAAGGAAVGAIAGDAGEGAAIGATAGAVKGRRDQKKDNAAAQQQAQQQAQAAQQGRMDQFKKGFCACMEGKGYTAK
jgi:Glycine-zipper domain